MSQYKSTIAKCSDAAPLTLYRAPAQPFLSSLVSGCCLSFDSEFEFCHYSMDPITVGPVTSGCCYQPRHSDTWHVCLQKVAAVVTVLAVLRGSSLVYKHPSALKRGLVLSWLAPLFIVRITMWWWLLCWWWRWWLRLLW